MPAALARTDDCGVPRDRHDRPLIHVPGRSKLVAYTRCTTFVDCIEDKTALATWGKRMVLVGATRDPRIIERARILDPHAEGDKQRLNHLAAQAASVAGADTKRDRGTHLHTLSEHADRGEPLPAASPDDIADLGAYLAATMYLDVVEIERLVVVDSLTVGGTPDRIYHYRGPGPDGEAFDANVIGDLKTGSVDRGALKMAMQLAIYSRAQFYDHRTHTRSPLPQVHQQWGLIIHLPAGTAQCTVYWIDLAAGWEAVLVARQIRVLRRAKKLLRPFRPGGTTPRPPGTTRDSPGPLQSCLTPALKCTSTQGEEGPVSASVPIGRGVTVTVKYGPGYESPWAVFHGQPREIHEDMVTFFGMAPEQASGLALSDLVVNATTQAQGTATVANGLGATVVESRPNQAPAATGTTTSASSDRPAEPDPWDQASGPQVAASAEPAANPILDRIAAAADVPSLQRIWAADPSAFTDPDIMAAWKARGRALTAV